MPMKSTVVRVAAMLALACSLPLASARDVPAMVGEATMVIGVARLVSASGGSEAAVTRGMAVRVGDRIETEAGGHVHLRFVDGGRVSVRPSSRLQIEDYSYSAQQPALAGIKFRLDEGVVRSITGSWGEAARERFRLNTPVAAIGVKGTDFIVRSDGERTSASVYSGAIVVAPLASGSGCAASLGPCQNGSEKLLSADMKGQAVELALQQASARLVPMEAPPQGRMARSAESGQKTTVSLREDDGHSDLSIDKTSLVVEGRVQPVLEGKDPVLPPPGNNGPELPAQVTQLAWGRWVGGAPAGDSLSKNYEDAKGNGRSAVVTSGYYSLYRDTSSAGSASALAATETSANFRLAGGAAQLVANQGRRIEALEVGAGTLNVNFAQSTFTTQLNVSNASIGTESISGAGSVRSNGLFSSQSGNTSISGALSLDNKEAGYYFDKLLPSGNLLRGITLWGR